MTSSLPMTDLVADDAGAVRDLLDLKAHVFQVPRPTQDDVEAQIIRAAEPGDRTVVVHDEGRAVASFRSFDTTVSVPGGTSVAANGVSGVVVLPTHKRRGLLTRWMTQDLHDARERGAVASVLYASDTGIYGRFGFGIATSHATATLHVPRARFHDDAMSAMRIVTGEQALDVLPEVARRAQLARPGSIEPRAAFWRGVTHQLPGRGEQDRRTWFGVHQDEDGRPDGVVSYTLEDHWSEGTSSSTARIGLLVAANPLAEQELWRHCAGIDFVVQVVHEMATPDLDLPWWLTDRRAVTLGSIWDGLWVRLLDVPTALAARRYPVVGRVTLEVIDPEGPTGGTYLLETDATGVGHCSPTTRDRADLTVPVSDLGSLWLGGASGVPSLSALVHAGRVALADPADLSRISALFGWPMPARSLVKF